MEEGIDKGMFIDHKKVQTALYGVSFAAVDKVRSDNRVCLIEVDVKAVKSIKESHLDCRYVFIAPNSIEDMVKKIRAKGTETEEKLISRTRAAKEDYEYATTVGIMDEVITYKSNNITFEALVMLFQNWFPDFDIYIDEDEGK